MARQTRGCRLGYAYNMGIWTSNHTTTPAGFPMLIGRRHRARQRRLRSRIAKSTHRSRRPRVESLEQRRLLVATVDVAVTGISQLEEDASGQIVYTFSRDETEGQLAVKFQLSGTATFGVDYLADEIENNTVRFPNEPPTSGPVTATATFLPGDATVQIAIDPLADTLIERDESVIVTVVSAAEFGPVTGAASKIVSREATEYYAVDNQNRLALVDVETGIAGSVGTINAAQSITDIAWTKAGDLFAITADRLYLVHSEMIGQATITTTFLGFHGIANANALIDSRDGDFGSDNGDLFAVGQNALDIHRINMGDVNGQPTMAGRTTVYDVDAALASMLLPSNYFSSGDLDYDSGGDLILSAFRPEDDFDSLIEIRTPGTAGAIAKAPKPAEDPGENFVGIQGLAFDGSASFAFAGRTLLGVNPFSHDSSRELELTGQPYVIGISSATGTIFGDPVAPPVITIHSGLANPPNLGSNPQPTTWATQRSQLTGIGVKLGIATNSIPSDAITLTNLGLTGTQTPREIPLDSSNIVFEPGSDHFVIVLAPGQLQSGRYELRLTRAITSGPEFVFAGNATNRFYSLTGDWDGNTLVDLRDFATFAYWYGQTTLVAPEYVDLDRSGTIDQDDFLVFANHYGRRVYVPGVVEPTVPDWIDADRLNQALQSAINPLDVNGNASVSPLDALQILNRLATTVPKVTDWQYDVNRDGAISPRDALQILNHLATLPTMQRPAGEFITSASLTFELSTSDDDNNEPLRWLDEVTVELKPPKLARFS